MREARDAALQFNLDSRNVKTFQGNLVEVCLPCYRFAASVCLTHGFPLVSRLLPPIALVLCASHAQRDVEKCKLTMDSVFEKLYDARFRFAEFSSATAMEFRRGMECGCPLLLCLCLSEMLFLYLPTLPPATSRGRGVQDAGEGSPGEF